MEIMDLLANDNYIPYNKTLAKELGIEPAILFGALCGYQRHYKMQEFYREQQKIIDDTCLTEYSIRQATKILQQKNLIIVNKKGLPAKYYYQINTKKLIEYLSTSGYENDTTGNNENDTTSNNEIATTNNKIKNKNNNKIDNNKENIKEKEIFDYWNSKPLIKHKDIKSHLKAIQTALKENSIEEIKTCIDRYSIVNNDKNYYFNYDWTLTNFLKQKNAMNEFKDDGGKWISYQNRKQETTEKKQTTTGSNFTPREYKETDFNNIFADLDNVKI